VQRLYALSATHEVVSNSLSRRALLPGTDLGSTGPYAILFFWAPRRWELFGCLSEKRESVPSPRVCSAPQKSIFCCADFGTMIILDQGSQNYGPRAISGPQRHFIRSAKRFFQ